MSNYNVFAPAARREAAEPGLQAPAMQQQQMQQPTMSQADFFKSGPRMDPKEKQRRLIQKLRERGDM